MDACLSAFDFFTDLGEYGRERIVLTQQTGVNTEAVPSGDGLSVLCLGGDRSETGIQQFLVSSSSFREV